MKRVVCAFVLLALLIALCAYEDYRVNAECDRIEDRISFCEDAIETDKNRCLSALDEIKDGWNKEQKLLTLFVNHAFIDEISERIAVLPVYAAADSKADFYSCCAVVKRILEQIRNDQQITIDSFY